MDTIYRYARLERNFADAPREQPVISPWDTFDAAAVTDDGSLGTLGSVGAKLESILGIDRRMKRVLAAKKATGKLTEDEDIDKAYTDPITWSAHQGKRHEKLVAAYIAQQNPTDPDDQADAAEPRRLRLRSRQRLSSNTHARAALVLLESYSCTVLRLYSF